MAKRSSKKKVSKKVVKKAPKARGESKMSKALEAYQDMTKRGLPVKGIVEHFVNVIGLTTAGARTYIQLCRKKLEQ